MQALWLCNIIFIYKHCSGYKLLFTFFGMRNYIMTYCHNLHPIGNDKVIHQTFQPAYCPFRRCSNRRKRLYFVQYKVYPFDSSKYLKIDNGIKL